MFERGITQHFHETFHQAAVQIPLMVFEPGQQSRKDVFTPTSAVDILPTLLHVSDKEIPDWCEGKILPPYSEEQPENNRSIFALEAKSNLMDKKISPGTGMIVKGEHKLVYYYDYAKLKNQGPLVELFNLENDPEELDNLYSTNSNLADNMLDELLDTMMAADAPYS